MPQRVAARPELVLQMRAERPGLNQRSPGNLIDLNDLIQLIQRDGNHRPGICRRVTPPTTELPPPYGIAQ